MFTTVTSRFQQLSAKHLITMVAVFGICATAFGYGVRARSAATSEKNHASTMRASNGKPAAQTQPTEKIEAELLTIRRFGFEPAAIKRPAGEVIFVINNRSRWQDWR